MMTAVTIQKQETIAAPLSTKRWDGLRQLTAAVGRYGLNRYIDVLTVQEMLNRVPLTAGGPVIPLAVNGRYGHRLEAAITGFERYHIPADSLDGRIDPGSRLWKRLLQFDLPGPAAPVETLLLVRQMGVFFEIRHTGTLERAVFSVSPEPAVVPHKWDGPVMEVELNGHIELADLIGPASFTTKLAGTRWTSEMVMRRKGIELRIPAVYHLCPASRMSMALAAVGVVRIQ